MVRLKMTGTNTTSAASSNTSKYSEIRTDSIASVEYDSDDDRADSVVSSSSQNTKIPLTQDQQIIEQHHLSDSDAEQNLASFNVFCEAMMNKKYELKWLQIISSVYNQQILRDENFRNRFFTLLDVLVKSHADLMDTIFVPVAVVSDNKKIADEQQEDSPRRTTSIASDDSVVDLNEFRNILNANDEKDAQNRRKESQDWMNDQQLKGQIALVKLVNQYAEEHKLHAPNIFVAVRTRTLKERKNNEPLASQEAEKFLKEDLRNPQLVASLLKEANEVSNGMNSPNQNSWLTQQKALLKDTQTFHQALKSLWVFPAVWPFRDKAGEDEQRKREFVRKVFKQLPIFTGGDEDSLEKTDLNGIVTPSRLDRLVTIRIGITPYQFTAKHLLLLIASDNTLKDIFMEEKMILWKNLFDRKKSIYVNPQHVVFTQDTAPVKTLFESENMMKAIGEYSQIMKQDPVKVPEQDVNNGKQNDTTAFFDAKQKKPESRPVMPNQNSAIDVTGTVFHHSADLKNQNSNNVTVLASLVSTSRQSTPGQK